jgi:vacuolar-type H+-ATPase subunit H
MGFLDDAKDAAEATGKRIGEAVDDAKERLGDKVDEAQADSKVRQAEAERDATKAKNEYKESLRD